MGLRHLAAEEGRLLSVVEDLGPLQRHRRLPRPVEGLRLGRLQPLGQRGDSRLAPRVEAGQHLAALHLGREEMLAVGEGPHSHLVQEGEGTQEGGGQLLGGEWSRPRGQTHKRKSDSDWNDAAVSVVGSVLCHRRRDGCVPIS